MATPHLARIAYASALHWELPRAELDALLSRWRRRNAERGVTGILLMHRDSAFQVLEGFPDIVQALYATISHDPRHRRVTKLIDELATTRSFGNWSLGLARMLRTDPGALPELSPLLDLASRPGSGRASGDASGAAFRLWQADESMARALIAAFSTGPWRRAIS
ncbi:MAG TPA: BLUF domain-containing protein [Kofleriaceae bacterium]|nr:BLUF domain-containing protein [Kofleriaceae bacterium]